MRTNPARIRTATAADMPAVHRLICELADYERATGEVSLTIEELIRDGFGEPKRFDCFVAEYEGEVVGMALCYLRYSTWKGVCYYLEDLIVTEAFRGGGLGSALLQRVVREAYDRGYYRTQWQVLDWNTPSIEFYEKAGAFIDREWYDCKMDRRAMEAYLNRFA